MGMDLLDFAMILGFRRVDNAQLCAYMARVFTGERTLLAPRARARPSASGAARCASTRARSGLEGVREGGGLVSPQSWCLILRTQTLHPWNPQDFH